MKRGKRGGHEVKFCEVSTPDGSMLVPYEVRRSRRSHHLRLTVSESNHILISLPWSTPEKMGIEFLKSKGRWVKETFQNLPSCVTVFDYLGRKKWISGEGRRIPVQLSLTCSDSTSAWRSEANSITFLLNPIASLDRQLVALLRNFANQSIRKRAGRLAERTKLDFERVSVRDQTTVWGSCSSRRNLSLNWRLIFLRPSLHDYIIYHELTHLAHMDHSPSFWRQLEAYDAQARNHDLSITLLSREIMALGRQR